MKVNIIKNIPQVNKIFTNREKPINVFWETYEEFKQNLNKPNDIKVITYYGLGGIGKTRLLNYLTREMNEKIHKPQYLYIDLKLNNDPRSILKNMRNRLQDKYDFTFPVFDLALFIYLKKVGEDTGQGEFKTLIEKNPYFELLLDLGSVLPFGGLVSSILKAADSLTTATRNNIKEREIELHGLQNEEPDFILDNLPYYFAGDLRNNLKDSKEPFVIFFDTYEALVNELSDIGEPLENDNWIRDERNGLITNVPNVIWVIAGRERIRWSLYNNQWDKALSQHLLGNLTEGDGERFLKGANIFDEKLISEIYELTNGTPMYLDLCVDNYYEILARGEEPILEKIGNTKNRLITRFLRYMDDSKKDLMFMLSCLHEWDEELLLELSKDILKGFAYSSLEKVKGYSFILSDDGINYTMHKTMKEAINKECPKSLKDAVNKKMESYYYNRLKEMGFAATGYASVLDKYIGYRLINIIDIKEFKTFYERYYLDYYNKLMESYQYMHLSSIQGGIAGFVYKIFGVCEETARTILDYSIVLTRLGKYKEGLHASEEAYVYYKKTQGEDHPNTINAMNNLSILYRSLGKYDEALKFAKKALGLAGKKNLDIIAIMNNLSVLYADKGQYEEALELSQKILKLRQEMQGEKHIDTVGSMNNVSLYFLKLGKFEKALELSKQVLNLRLEIQGKEHTDTLDAMNNLSIIYRDLGKYNETLNLTKEALCLSRKIRGEEHPETLKTMDNLSIIYRSLGRFEESLGISKKVLRLSIKVLSKDHVFTINAMNSLSICYGYLGKYNEALGLSEEVLLLRQQILGDKHPDTISAMDNLSFCYNNLGRYEDALALSKKVLYLRQSKLSCGHPDIINAMNNLSIIHYELRNYKEALDLSKEVLKLSRKAYGERHPSTIKAMFVLSKRYSGLNDYKKASELLDRARKLIEKITSEDM